MSDLEKTEVIHGIEVSADGKRNSFSARCDTLGQVMNYAACLWRQEVLSAPDIKTPADWEQCRNAAKCGTCNANLMRQEELLAGKSIYFRERGVISRVADAARRWIGPSTTRQSAAAPPETPVKAKAKSMLDVMGSDSGYADAINATAATETLPVAVPVKVVRVVPIAIPVATPVALAGESPFQMARRIAAEKAALSV